MTLAVKVALNPNTTNQPTNQPITRNQNLEWSKLKQVTDDIWKYV